MTTRELRVFSIDRAIEAAGGIRPFCAKHGLTHQAVYHWKKKGCVPLPRALEIEREHGIPALNLVEPQLAATVRQLVALSA